MWHGREHFVEPPADQRKGQAHQRDHQTGREEPPPQLAGNGSLRPGVVEHLPPGDGGKVAQPDQTDPCFGQNHPGNRQRHDGKPVGKKRGDDVAQGQPYLACPQRAAGLDKGLVADAQRLRVHGLEGPSPEEQNRQHKKGPQGGAVDHRNDDQKRHQRHQREELIKPVEQGIDPPAPAGGQHA